MKKLSGHQSEAFSEGPSDGNRAALRISKSLKPASITTSAFGSCEEPYLVDPVDWAAPDCRRATASQRVAFNLQPLHRQGWVGVEASGVRKQGRLID